MKAMRLHGSQTLENVYYLQENEKKNYGEI